MKNNKGITLITLTVAVLIMIILSSMLIYNAKNGLKMKNLKDMQNDIEILEDKVNAYYVKYADIPAEIEYLGNINFEPQPNDDDEYYVLDLKALEGISLNYGSEFTQIKTREDTYQYNDVYIINKQSFHIYYAKGIEIDGVAYYTNSEDESVHSYRGAYLVAKKEYANTLKEALEIAQKGDTIKVLKDVEEETHLDITKDIIIDTNGKIISYKDEYYAMSIGEGAKVKIMGNGIIKSDYAGTTIGLGTNSELTIENTTIYSNNKGGLSGTISMIDKGGKLFLNNAKVNSITIEGGKSISIDGGKYGYITSRSLNESAIIKIKSANINKIYIRTGELTFESGTINEIEFYDEFAPKITIGNKSDDVSSINPSVKRVSVTVGVLDESNVPIFEYYNGRIGEFYHTRNKQVVSMDSIYWITKKIRDGYQVKKTTDGYILVPKT